MERPFAPQPTTVLDFGPSPEVFGDMKLESIFGPMGRNYGIGWYDDFTRIPTLQGNAGYDGYGRLTTGNDSGITIALIDSTAGTSATTGIGVLRIAMDTGTANDEAVFQLGDLVDDGIFRITLSPNRDLAFETRFTVSAITASKWSWFVGLCQGGSAGAAITDKLFADTTGAVVTGANQLNMVGFQKLYAEAGPVDGMYAAANQTKQDGATKTKLDTLHTMVASTFVKLGFRYRSATSTLHWYVNGVETDAAKLTKAELEAATFPDGVGMAPTFAIKNIAGDTALNMDIDWGLCAQSLA